MSWDHGHLGLDSRSTSSASVQKLDRDEEAVPLLEASPAGALPGIASYALLLCHARDAIVLMSGAGSER